MADIFSTNNTPVSHAQAMYVTISTMMRAGWNCLAWCDGLTGSLPNLTGTIPGPYAAGAGSPDAVYPLTGTFQNQGATGTLGLGNPRAWGLFRQPKGSGSVGFYTGKRMIVIQKGHDTTHALWRIKYSLTGGYINGLSTFNNTPGGAADEVFLNGGGTDASPTFIAIFASALNGLSRHNVMANDGLSGELSPFGMYSLSFAAGGAQSCHHAWVIDPCENGTGAPQDVDPFVFYTDGTVGNSFRMPAAFPVGQTGYMQSRGGVQAWYRYAQSGRSFENVCAGIYSACGSDTSGPSIVAPPDINTTPVVHPIGTNVHNANDDLFPIPYLKRADTGGNAGYKGISSMVRWLSSPRSVGDTYTFSTVRDRFSVGTAVLRWSGEVPLV